MVAPASTTAMAANCRSPLMRLTYARANEQIVATMAAKPLYPSIKLNACGRPAMASRARIAASQGNAGSAVSNQGSAKRWIRRSSSQTAIPAATSEELRALGLDGLLPAAGGRASAPPVDPEPGRRPMQEA